jgi:hypothetical protein
MFINQIRADLKAMGLDPDLSPEFLNHLAEFDHLDSKYFDAIATAERPKKIELLEEYVLKCFDLSAEHITTLSIFRNGSIDDYEKCLRCFKTQCEKRAEMARRNASEEERAEFIARIKLRLMARERFYVAQFIGGLAETSEHDAATVQESVSPPRRQQLTEKNEPITQERLTVQRDNPRKFRESSVQILQLLTSLNFVKDGKLKGEKKNLEVFCQNADKKKIGHPSGDNWGNTWIRTLDRQADGYRTVGNYLRSLVNRARKSS